MEPFVGQRVRNIWKESGFEEFHIKTTNHRSERTAHAGTEYLFIESILESEVVVD